MKRRYFISLFALSLLLASCLSWIIKNPSFVVHDVTIRARSFTEMNLIVGLEIKNPNRFDLTIESFEYTIYLNNEEFGNGSLEKKILLRSSSVTPAHLPVMAKLKGLENLKTIITGKDLNYKIVGKVNVKTVLGRFNFPFSKEGNINLRKSVTLQHSINHRLKSS